MTNLAKRDRTAEISRQPAHGLVPAPKQYRIVQQPDPRPAQYQTMRDRGHAPQAIKRPVVPNVLSMALAAIVALSFLVAASMFSISLTAYSNSVDRVDDNRSLVRFE
jgi:hypothetical protein